jgi:hypothetical protein
MGTKHVPESLLEGVTDSEEEAEELAFKINVKRDEAIFAEKAKHGLPGILGMK